MTLVVGSSHAFGNKWINSDYNEVARLVGPVPQNCWAVRVRVFGGKPVGAVTNPEVVLAVWEAISVDNDQDGVVEGFLAGADPSSRSGRSAPVLATAEFDDTGGGAMLSELFAHVAVEWGSPTHFPMRARSWWYVGYRDNTGTFRAGYAGGDRVREIVFGTGVEGLGPTGTHPANPFDIKAKDLTTPSLVVSIVAEQNRAPNIPTDLEPAQDGETADTTPTFRATFDDPDLEYGDQVGRYQIQVRRAPSNVVIWDREYDAPPEERASGEIARVYQGSDMDAGESLEWRIRMGDIFGTYGMWSNQHQNVNGNIVNDPWVTFTVRGAGAAAVTTVQGVASGKIDDYSPDLAGTYNHVNSLAMSTIQFRVYQGRLLVRGPSAALSAVVASGATWSKTWAQTGFADLEPGVTYTIQARARDSASVLGAWLPAPGLSITPNARPSTPANIQPTNNRAMSVRPEVTFVMTDADDTVATGLTAEVEITRPDMTAVTRSATQVDAGLGTWNYQTTVSDITIFGTYILRARGSDGTLVGAWSAPASFRYLEGPALTLTTPTQDQVLATNQPIFAWTTIADQASYRIVIVTQVGNVTAYDSGVRASPTAASHQVESGWLHDDTAYLATVEVTNNSGLAGIVERRFTVDYPTPDVLPNVQGSAFASELDGEYPSAILFTWDAPDTSTSTFWQYVVEQEEQGKPETRAIVAQLPSIAQTAWVDYEPRSGVTYVYRVWWEELQGTDVRPSVVAEFVLSVDLRSTVIHLADQPEAARVHLPYYDSREFEFSPNIEMVPTWAPGAPTAIGHPSAAETITISTRLADLPNEPTAIDVLNQLRAIYFVDGDRGDRIPRMETVCVRTPRGDRIYGVIMNVRRSDMTQGGEYEMEIEIKPTSYRKPLASS